MLWKKQATEGRVDVFAGKAHRHKTDQEARIKELCQRQCKNTPPATIEFVPPDLTEEGHMENDLIMRDTFQQTDLPEREMINRDKHGAVMELAGRVIPKKVITKTLGVSVKSVHRILKRSEWKPYKRRLPTKMVLGGFESFLTRHAPEVNFNAKVLFKEVKLLGWQNKN